ncbi:MAG TPA: IPT/TIG domain-containing protein, partial [Ferruginibacter sp.]|nr:IPT/TIG domain-containing protein [Ferruginibacter sp.]
MKLFYPARLSLFILLLLAGINVCSQCSMYPVPFEQRVNQAAYIVQGKVTEQHCYIDRATGYVNTLNKFRVSAWLKNYSADEYIYIITLGGVYGDKAMVVTPALQLDTHHEYLLMLEADKHVLDDEQFRALHPSAMQLMAYADAQGSLTNENNLYHDLYYKTPRPETKLFAEISRMTGQSAVKPSGEPFVPREVIQPANNGITAISSFSPNPTNAGTIVAGDQLTITGSGFGAAAGTVFYSNANDGGATFTASGVASDNVSWADATIVNKVAVVAGT